MRLYCPRCRELVLVGPGRQPKLRCPRCGTELARDVRTSAAATVVDDPGSAPRHPSSPGDSGIGKAIASQPTLGPYVVLSELGRGSMGRVYRAMHKTLRKVRALKVLSKSERNPKVIARFQREARLVSELDHPNIVRMFEFAQDKEKGYYYFVMEFVEGGSVRQILQNRGKLPCAQAVEITLQVARGLNEMYQHNLVHRDVKPSNILIDRTGTAKLADLGLARHEGDQDSQLTGTGMMLGTIDYIAPEQIVDCRQVDIRADLYALGCTLFHMLTGEVPYQEGSTYQKIQQHMHSPLPEVGRLAPDVPFRLVLILNRLTAKEPSDRYQSPGEFIAALQEDMGPPNVGEPLERQEALASQLAALSADTAPVISSTLTARSSRLSRFAAQFAAWPQWARIAAGAAAGLLGLLGVWLAIRPGAATDLGTGGAPKVYEMVPPSRDEVPFLNPLERGKRQTPSLDKFRSGEEQPPPVKP